MDQNTPHAPAPSHAAAKGLALGMGVLLLGGTALLITLLITRESETQVRDIPKIELGEGEDVLSASATDDTLTILVSTRSGGRKAVIIDLATGAREEVEFYMP
jgi:hypothetical protein